MKRRIVCAQCGNKHDWPDGKTEGFCAACGSLIAVDAPTINERPVKQPGKAAWLLLGGGIAALILIVLALLMYPRVSSLLSPPDGTQYEGTGFDTPEDAATAYLNALKALDLDAMVSTFAIESYVDNYNWTEYIRQIKVYTPSFAILGNSSLVRDLNIENRKFDITRGLQNNIYDLFFSWEDNTLLNSTIRLDDSNVNKFLNTMQANDFADKLAMLEVIEFVKPEDLSDQYIDEFTRAGMGTALSMYGFEDYTEIAAFIEIGGEEYLFAVSAALYNDRWYLVMPGGTIGILVGMNFTYRSAIARVDGLDLSGYR